MLTALLKRKLSEKKGFTLVELLIVISIIAILSVVGITVFNGLQVSARNAARREDIDAIAKALEVGKTDSGYQPLQATQFANGSIPTADRQNLAYCYVANSTSASITGASTNATTCTPSATYAVVSGSIPAANTASWKVCTWLEAAGTTAAGAYCRTNQQ